MRFGRDVQLWVARRLFNDPEGFRQSNSSQKTGWYFVKQSIKLYEDLAYSTTHGQVSTLQQNAMINTLPSTCL